MSYAAGASDHTSSSTSSEMHAGQQTGLSRNEVKQAQEKLKSEGLYNGQIDGIEGPETKQALEQFQQKNGLQQTGMLDHKTLSALMSGETMGAGSSTPPSSRGTQGSSGSNMHQGTSNDMNQGTSEKQH